MLPPITACTRSIAKTSSSQALTSAMSAGVMTGNSGPHRSALPGLNERGEVEPYGEPSGLGTTTRYLSVRIPKPGPCPTTLFHHPFSPSSGTSTGNGEFDIEGQSSTAGRLGSPNDANFICRLPGGSTPPRCSGKPQRLDSFARPTITSPECSKVSTTEADFRRKIVDMVATDSNSRVPTNAADAGLRAVQKLKACTEDCKRDRNDQEAAQKKK